MTRALPEGDLGGEAAHLVAFLGFHRATVLDKCRSLSAAELRTVRVPSGWSPLALLWHVASMERRWVLWGFLGEAVDDPYRDGEDPWRVPSDVALEEIAGQMADVAARTDALLTGTPLDTRGSVRGRFGREGAERFDAIGGPPTLRWIGFHLLQEYARHAGQLDVATELAGGHVGE